MDDIGIFMELYREWWSAVCTSAKLLLASSADAEDAAQRVFMRLWSTRSWGRIRAPGPFFRRAGRSEALSMLRRRRSRGDDARTLSFDELSAPLLESRTPRPDQQVLQVECRRHVSGAIASLPPRCRQVCRLFFFDGLERREVADRLGVTIKAVEKQLARGRRHLRELLDPSDFSVSFLEDGGV